MSDLFKINVDGKEIEVPKSYTLMQACEEAGAEIPRFCYHERLSCRQLPHVPGRVGRRAEADCVLRAGVGDMRPNRDGSAPNIRTKGPMSRRPAKG
jgi:NADH-quinone oxidoreductase subunit G